MPTLSKSKRYGERERWGREGRGRDEEGEKEGRRMKGKEGEKKGIEGGKQRWRAGRGRN
jgi:hypothetical protein